MCCEALTEGLTLEELPWPGNDKDFYDTKAAIERSLDKKKQQEEKDNDVWNDLRRIFLSSSGMNQSLGWVCILVFLKSCF